MICLVTESRAGWYPDAADPSRARWWNGSEWTSMTRSAAGMPPPAPVVERPPLDDARWSRLALAVQFMLGLNVVASLGVIVADRFIIGVGDQFAIRPRRVEIEDAEMADSLLLIGTVGPVVLTLLAGVPFIIWLYQAHRSDRMDPSLLRHGSGWAIGGWFVPFLNLWRPFGMVSDVRRGIDGQGPGLVQVFWWTGWIVSLLTWNVVSGMWPGAEVVDPREYGRQLSLAAKGDAVASGIDAVTALLAILLVRQVTRIVLASPHGRRSGLVEQQTAPAEPA